MKIVTIIVAVVAFFFLFAAFDIGFDRKEKAECMEWQGLSVSNPIALTGYAQWQVDQCNAHGINVGWPVK